MATYEEVMGALRNAHDAGDEESATRLAKMAQGLKSDTSSNPVVSGGKGTLAAVGDIAGGLVKAPAQAMLAVGGKIAEPSRSLQDTWDTAGHAMEETFPSFGKDMEHNLGYTVPMKPFELYGKGMNKAASVLSNGNKDVEGAINVAANFLPIPFVKPVGKGIGKVFETLDPALRKEVPKAEISKLETLQNNNLPKSIDEHIQEQYKQAALEKQQAAIDAANQRGQVPIPIDSEGNAGVPGVRNGPFGRETPMESMSRQLGAEKPIEPIPDTPMSRMAQDVTSERSTPESHAAQDFVEQRQADMEYGVKKQVVSEQNVAERARQENAPVLPNHTQELAARVEEHPIVQAATEKAERAATKVQALEDAVANGETNGVAVIAARNAAKQAAATLEKARVNISEAFSKGDSPKPFNGTGRGLNVGNRRQGGAINPEVFKDGFNKVKELTEKGIRLIAKGDNNYLRVFVEDTTGKHPNSDLGGAVFKSTDKWANPSETNLASSATGIVPEARGGNLSKEVYKFVSELGNDIVPDKIRTADGKSMWDKFEKSGLSQGMRIPKSQRGGVYFGENSSISKVVDNINDAIKKVSNFKFDADKAVHSYLTKNIPEALEGNTAKFATPDTPDVTIQKILDPSAKDTPSIWQWNQSGPGLTAAKFQNNPLLVSVSRSFNQALHLSEIGVRQLVRPLERFISTLSSKEFRENEALFKHEMFDEKKHTPEQLKEAGYTDRQIQAYQLRRSAFDTALAIQNKNLKAMGKDPIKQGEAYLSSIWHGDYHTPILDKNGKLVWYVRTTTNADGVKAINYLREKMGDTLNIPNDLKPQRRETGRNPTTPSDVMGTYHDMIDFFKDQPEISNQIKAALEGFMQEKGYSIAGQNKHFLNKSNVHGFEGDKPWLSEKEIYCSS